MISRREFAIYARKLFNQNAKEKQKKSKYVKKHIKFDDKLRRKLKLMAAADSGRWGYLNSI